MKLAHLHTKAPLFKHTAVFMSARHSSRFASMIAVPSAAKGGRRGSTCGISSAPSPRSAGRAPAAGSGWSWISPLPGWTGESRRAPPFPSLKPFLRQQLLQNGHGRHELGQRGEAAAFLSSRGGMFHVSVAELRRSPAPRGRGRRQGGRCGAARARPAPAGSRIPPPPRASEPGGARSPPPPCVRVPGGPGPVRAVRSGPRTRLALPLCRCLATGRGMGTGSGGWMRARPHADEQRPSGGRRPRPPGGPAAAPAGRHPPAALGRPGPVLLKTPLRALCAQLCPAFVPAPGAQRCGARPRPGRGPGRLLAPRPRLLLPRPTLPTGGLGGAECVGCFAGRGGGERGAEGRGRGLVLGPSEMGGG